MVPFDTPTTAPGIRTATPEEAVATGLRASGPANSEEAVTIGHRAFGPANPEEAVATGLRASGPAARPTPSRQERAPISNAVSDERYGRSFYLSAYLIRIRICPKFHLLRPYPARPLLTFLSLRFRRFLPHLPVSDKTGLHASPYIRTLFPRSQYPGGLAFSNTFSQPGPRILRTSAPFPRSQYPGGLAFSHTFSQPAPEYSVHLHPFPHSRHPEGPRIFIHIFATGPGYSALSFPEFSVPRPVPSDSPSEAHAPQAIFRLPAPNASPRTDSRSIQQTPAPFRISCSRPFHEHASGAPLLQPAPAGSRYETPPEMLRPPFPPRPPTEKGVSTST